MNDSDFDYDVELSDGNSPRDNDSREPRQGRFWVRKHNHEILASGDDKCPEPDNSGVVLRRYFASLDEAIVAWGQWPSHSTNSFAKIAKEAVIEAAQMESTEPLEYFFVESSMQYIAVVMRNCGGAGRMWINKNEIHLLSHISGSKPFTLKGKTFYRITLSGGTTPPGTKKMCAVTYQSVPGNGICPCESPNCPYSAVSQQAD